LIVGARGQVGATTIALNLTAAMRTHDVKPLLIDADPRGGDLATLGGLRDTPSLGDVLAGRRSVWEVIRRGPGGVDLIPGVCGMERLSDHPSHACRPLVEQLGGLAGRADWVLLDAGLPDSPMAGRFQAIADVLIVVTTPESGAVMDAYAAIKSFCRAHEDTAVMAAINRAGSHEEADEAQGRLVTACRRFLAFELVTLGPVLDDPQIPRLVQRGQTLVAAEPSGNSARAMLRAARQLIETPRIRRPVVSPTVQIVGPFRATLPT
jgi:flagellar biosynthesis protein FlhG